LNNLVTPLLSCRLLLLYMTTVNPSASPSFVFTSVVLGCSEPLDSESKSFFPSFLHFHSEFL
ncbi:unnamed protein product, partial [Prunus brigantina]